MVGLTAAFALMEGACLAVVAVVAAVVADAELATPTPSRVPAMASDAPAAASSARSASGQWKYA